jgi:hypothetical protein
MDHGPITDEEVIDLALHLRPEKKSKLLEALQRDAEEERMLVDKGGVLVFRGRRTGPVEQTLDEVRLERDSTLANGTSA